jgi:AbiV family abortive infection protein
MSNVGRLRKMRATLSVRKYKQLAVESLRNSLRLLNDAVSLFSLRSYPSEFQLAVLSMEEYAKARWVEHVCYAELTNPGTSDAGAEQSWLKYLYLHSEKQHAFLAREYFEFSPKFLRAVKDGELDRRKQAATYVGLPKRGKLVDVNARVSTPTSVTQKDAKQMISLVAREVRDVYWLIEENETYFGIDEMNEVITSHEAMFVFAWPYGSGVKSTRFRSQHGSSPVLKKNAQPPKTR